MNDLDKSGILQLIELGKIDEVIDSLMSLELGESQKQRVYAISSEFERLKQKSRAGLITSEQETISENHIVSRLLEVVNSEDRPADDGNPGRNLKTKGSRSIKITILTAVGLTLLFLLAKSTGVLNVFSSGNQPEIHQLTVFVKDIHGNAVLEHTGRLNIPLGNRSLNETIGANGRTNFPDIVAANVGDEIQIGLDAEGWEIVDDQNRFVFTGDPIELIVKKDETLGTIKGIVKDRSGQLFIAGASVLINSDTSITSNTGGLFRIVLPESMRVSRKTEGYLLTVSANGYKTYTDYYYPGSSDAEIRLEKM